MDVMKIVYHYDYKTFTYQGESQIHKVVGYEDYILPQFSTWVPVPSFDKESEQAEFSLESQEWVVGLKPVEVTAYHKQTQETKVFTDASLITDDYTDQVPLDSESIWNISGWEVPREIMFARSLASLNYNYESDVHSLNLSMANVILTNSADESTKKAALQQRFAERKAQYDADKAALFLEYGLV